ncbi:MAG: VWA domain-containing protein [Proteobacteria bacterium]|nr:MAG: VWA domain-containing protein [Pseudomonadota bacterium]
MSKLLSKNLINHVVLSLDASSSIEDRGLTDTLVKVSDTIISQLAELSKDTDQETRVSIYLFGSTVECLVYDKDVLRLPSVKSFYKADGMTALIDGTLNPIFDLEKTATLYGDHSFLVYVLTDGEENYSNRKSSELVSKLRSLPENWTVATFVPNKRGVDFALKAGFSDNNIQIWGTTTVGLKDVETKIKKANTSYFAARASGVRGTKNLFELNSNNLNTNVIQKTLDSLTPGKDYDLFPVRTDAVIKDFVESWTQQPYRVGSAYYMLSKPEKIQASKQILIEDKFNGKVYTGDQARSLLNLPNFEVKVNPLDHSKYNVFVQSTSTNRKLIRDTKLIIVK